MPPPVIFHPLAKREFQERALYYEDQSYGLGSEFRTEVRVVAVSHHRQRPFYWLERTRDRGWISPG